MGDLISRSAMLEAVDERERIARKFVPDLEDDELRPTLKSIREFIANRPAVDAEPVRHGKWINAGHDAFTQYRRCSSCARILANPPAYDYCPGCGAKMDGGNERSVTHRAD